MFFFVNSFYFFFKWLLIFIIQSILKVFKILYRTFYVEFFFLHKNLSGVISESLIIESYCNINDNIYQSKKVFTMYHFGSSRA